MDDMHYAILVEFPSVKGMPPLYVNSNSVPCWFQQRQNRHGNEYTSPPLSFWGEVGFAPDDARLRLVSRVWEMRKLDAADPLLPGLVTAHSWFGIGPKPEHKRLDRKDAFVWLAAIAGRALVRWVDLATFNATGSTNAFPPPMPPALPPIDKSTLTYPERPPSAKMHDLLNSPTEGTDIVTNVSFDSKGRAKIGPSSN